VEPQGEPTHEELLLLLSAKDVTIKSLTGLVEQLAARVAELERRLRKDSSNSSKPPSSDAPFAKPAPKRSSRTRSGRRPGKQDGTPGSTLKRVEDPDAAQDARQVGRGDAPLRSVDRPHVRTDPAVRRVQQLLQHRDVGCRLVHAKEATDGNLRFSTATRACYTRRRDC